MAESMKFLLRIVGIGALLLLFGVVYSLVTDLKVDMSDFSTQPKHVGSLGGFHLLTDVRAEEQDTFWRIAIHTTLNRVSPILEQIETPYINVSAPQAVDLSSVNQALGEYYLQVDLADTSVFDQTGGAREYVLVTPATQTINQGNITSIHVQAGQNDSSYQILVGLSTPAEFRLQENPDEPSIVWLDILK